MTRIPAEGIARRISERSGLRPSLLPATAALAYHRALDALIRFPPPGPTRRAAGGPTPCAPARPAGLPMASACGADGLCARCGVRVLAGAGSLSAETEWEARQKRRNRIDPELRLACRTEATGDVEVTAGYW